MGIGVSYTFDNSNPTMSTSSSDNGVISSSKKKKTKKEKSGKYYNYRAN